MKHLVSVLGLPALAVVAVFVFAFQFVKPAPPDHITLASGGEGGAYHRFSKAYAEYLEREGIELTIVNTGGSVENLALLREGKVDVAFVQGGVEDQREGEPLNSLTSLYYEPLWLFHRHGTSFDRLENLSGHRVAVGASGSGTRALVEQLLALNDLDEANVIQLPMGGSEAVSALLNGEVEAAFFVSSPKSEVLQTLLNDPDIRLASLERADAYSRRLRFLSHLTLPEGLVDLEKNLPPRDIALLAPAANLVSNADLHPAIIDLLLMAAQQEHAAGDWFEHRNEFPKNDYLAYPIHEEAERFLAQGPPFLQQYLPFWAASLIDRLKVMILPLVLMLLPLIKVMPPVYNWRMRARVYRWYSELDDVDQALFSSDPVDQKKCSQLSLDLDRIEADVRQVSIPLSFSNQLYHLRQHIDFVRKRLSAKESG